MEEYQYIFSEKDFVKRSIFFGVSVTLIAALCLFHGIAGRAKTISVIDQMLANGELMGKFWRVIKIQTGQITISKYQRNIRLVSAFPKDAHIGDKISFIAKIEKRKGRSAFLWRPTKIRFHGTSSFRYWVSLISVLVVLVMGLKYLRFDRRSFSLTFKGDKTDA